MARTAKTFFMIRIIWIIKENICISLGAHFYLNLIFYFYTWEAGHKKINLFTSKPTVKIPLGHKNLIRKKSSLKNSQQYLTIWSRWDRPNKKFWKFMMKICWIEKLPANKVSFPSWTNSYIRNVKWNDLPEPGILLFQSFALLFWNQKVSLVVHHHFLCFFVNFCQLLLAIFAWICFLRAPGDLKFSWSPLRNQTIMFIYCVCHSMKTTPGHSIFVQCWVRAPSTFS